MTALRGTMQDFYINSRLSLLAIFVCAYVRNVFCAYAVLYDVDIVYLVRTKLDIEVGGGYIYNALRDIGGGAQLNVTFRYIRGRGHKMIETVVM